MGRGPVDYMSFMSYYSSYCPNAFTVIVCGVFGLAGFPDGTSSCRTTRSSCSTAEVKVPARSVVAARLDGTILCRTTCTSCSTTEVAVPTRVVVSL